MPPLPPIILKTRPHLARVDEAWDAFARGEPDAVRCDLCGTIIHVEKVPVIGSIWARCEKGCSSGRISGPRPNGRG